MEFILTRNTLRLSIVFLNIVFKISGQEGDKFSYHFISFKLLCRLASYSPFIYEDQSGDFVNIYVVDSRKLFIIIQISYSISALASLIINNIYSIATHLQAGIWFRDLQFLHQNRITQNFLCQPCCFGGCSDDNPVKQSVFSRTK